MILSIAIALLATAGGALATYLYDEGASLGVRLCTGACIGLAALGLIGFVLASFLGLTPLSIVMTTVVMVTPFLLFLHTNRRKQILADLNSRRLSQIQIRILFSFTGRIGRATFWATGIGLIAVSLIVGLLIGAISNTGDGGQAAGLVIYVLWLAAVVWVGLAAQVKRWHDLGYSGWLALIGFIPIIGGIALVYLGCVKGTAGRNEQGPDPLPAPWSRGFCYFLYYAFAAVLLWKIFDRAMIETPEGIFTGLLNNFGDLPFHLSVITGFAFGDNFPPQDPTYAGVRFTYPFLTDFVSAIFVRCGADLRQSMFLENFVVALAFVGLMHRWALELVRDRLAAIMTPILVLLSGGFGWILLGNQLTQKNDEGLLGILKNLPPSFTVIPETTWRWGNALSTLLIPQRGFLLGLPLAVVVFTQWWLSAEKPGEKEKGEKGETGQSKKRKKQKKVQIQEQEPAPIASGSFTRFPLLPLSPSTRRMIAAGVAAGLLPLVHAHSFVVVMVVGGCIGLLQRRWRDWITFAVVASLIALPQMWWSTHNSAVDAKQFFEWQFGWDHGQENPAWFWLKNTGLFIPLTIAALLWRRDNQALVTRRLLIFFLPFTLCFIIPNVLKMAPWIWDNIKVLFYWWLASAPLVALLLARLWREGGVKRALALSLFACVTLAGALDVAAIVLRSSEYGIFTAPGIQFAELVKRETPPQAVVIHAPVHNHPVFLTGRRSLMGYPGHVWTHGLEFAGRESEIKRVYAGSSDAMGIIRKYGVEYAVVGPLEANLMGVNDQFFSRFQLVGEVGGYRLYKTKQQ